MNSTVSEWMRDYVWPEIEAVAHKAICQAAIVLNRDILQWANFVEIIPVQQFNIMQDLMLWVPEEMISTLYKSWHNNRKRVNAWKLL
jgi:hypothetical protein